MIIKITINTKENKMPNNNNQHQKPLMEELYKEELEILKSRDKNLKPKIGNYPLKQ